MVLENFFAVFFLVLFFFVPLAEICVNFFPVFFVVCAMVLPNFFAVFGVLEIVRSLLLLISSHHTSFSYSHFLDFLHLVFPLLASTSSYIPHFSAPTSSLHFLLHPASSYSPLPLPPSPFFGPVRARPHETPLEEEQWLLES
jgi:hypothetical protein